MTEERLQRIYQAELAEALEAGTRRVSTWPASGFYCL